MLRSEPVHQRVGVVGRGAAPGGLEPRGGVPVVRPRGLRRAAAAQTAEDASLLP